MNAVQPQLAEKPDNGFKGLRHWRHDLLAGLVVSFVSLPLSSGIAIASGAPPIYGIISAIIGGLIFPLVGGSFMTISGPAAGLAPALLAIMVSLGGAGDADHVGEGYHRLLVVIFIVGILQVILAALKLARYAAIFPASVVEGMLAAIGVLVFVKALPLFLGYTEPVHGHDFIAYLEEIPHWFAHLHPGAFAVGAASLVVMAFAGSKFAKRFWLFRAIPPHVYAVATGAIGAIALSLDASFLITSPSDPFSQIKPPDFAGVFSDSSLWWTVAVGVVTLTLIDGVESLATGQAIDRVDPYRRRSKPNRLLGAMGLSNAISAVFGGLTVIPGGVKSKTNIEAGGRTIWSNFYLACFLILYIVAVPGLIGLIPKSTLGAVLLLTGWKMAHPRIAKNLASIGSEQFILYGSTILVTLFADLLVGVLVGTAAKLVFIVAKTTPSVGVRGLHGLTASVFRDPVASASVEGDCLELHLKGPLVCFNSFRLMERIEQHIAKGDLEAVRKIAVIVGPGVPAVDHTSLDSLLLAIESVTDHEIEIVGLDRLKPLTPHPVATHLARFDAVGG